MKVRIKPTLSLLMLGVGYLPGRAVVVQLPLVAVLFEFHEREPAEREPEIAVA